jgi:Uma2 family endonuclease
MVGILDDDRIELIDGYLLKKMGKKPPHVWAVHTTEELLRALLPPGWCIRREGPVRIPDFDEPEPDLALAEGTRAFYRTRHPEPSEIALLIEVAEAALARDRGEKRVAYARGTIPVYWIVNLIDRQAEVYPNPRSGKYRSRRTYKPGHDVPVVVEGVEVGRIAAAGILR